MQKGTKEITPVIYNAGATVINHYAPKKSAVCFPLHWHERMEVLYMKQGELEYVCGHEKGVLRTGQSLFIPPRFIHAGRAKTDCLYDVLMFDIRNFYNEAEACKKYLSAIFEGCVEVNPLVTDGEMIETVKRLCERENPESLRAVADIYILLDWYINKGVLQFTDKPRDGEIAEIVRYIEENFDTDLTTAHICEKFGYTLAYFCRKFKRAMGVSPLAYIKIYRLERAYKMIRHGEGQIFEIAAKCGFPDPNYFTRCFTARYKNPPSFYKATTKL